MPRFISPYDRSDDFWESGWGVKIILILTAGIPALLLHIAVIWVFLFLLSNPTPRKLMPEDYLIVDFLGDQLPQAGAAPEAPVDKDLKGPDVVEATQSAPATPQPFTPSTPEAIAPPPDVIPLGPKAPETPPKIEKKSPPPKVTPPKVREDPPPKKADPKPNPDAELNKTLAELRRKVEARENQEAEGTHVNIAKAEGSGSGEGSQAAGSRGDVRLDPRIASYYRHIHDIIRNNWSWVSSPDTDESKLETEVGVVIEPNGRISSIKITRTSGNSDYDLSVARAVNKSNPFPALPPVFEGRSHSIILRFKPADLRGAQ